MQCTSQQICRTAIDSRIEYLTDLSGLEVSLVVLLFPGKWFNFPNRDHKIQDSVSDSVENLDQSPRAEFTPCLNTVLTIVYTCAQNDCQVANAYLKIVRIPRLHKLFNAGNALAAVELRESFSIVFRHANGWNRRVSQTRSEWPRKVPLQLNAPNTIVGECYVIRIAVRFPDKPFFEWAAPQTGRKDLAFAQE